MRSAVNSYAPNDCENIILEDISKLPVGTEAAYLKEGFVGLCRSGSAVIELFDNVARIHKNDLVILLPLHFALLRDKSDDFSMSFFKVSRDMFLDIMSGMCRMTTDFYFYMRKNFCFHLNDKQIREYNDWCELFNVSVTGKKPKYRRETALHFYRTFFWNLYVEYLENAEELKSCNFTHKEQLIFKFSMLVIENYKTAREVSFYADKLCITPKYLTLISSQVTGQSARECIADFVILEMKSLLRNANLDIKELVKQVGFRNQSALSRYFRRHTGMSPSEYRDSIHMSRSFHVCDSDKRGCVKHR